MLRTFSKVPRNFKKIDLSCLLVIAQKRGGGTGACYLNCTQMRTSLGGLYSQLGRDFAFLGSVEAWGAPMGHSAIEPPASLREASVYLLSLDVGATSVPQENPIQGPLSGAPLPTVQQKEPILKLSLELCTSL